MGNVDLVSHFGFGFGVISLSSLRVLKHENEVTHSDKKRFANFISPIRTLEPSLLC